MVVPLGWTLDDRREPTPRLFRSPAVDTTDAIPRPARKKKSKRAKDEQLRLDQTDAPAPSSTREPVVSRLFETPPRTPRKPRSGEALPKPVPEPVPAPVPQPDEAPAAGDSGPWYPAFDDQDDLGGLLIPKGPLMSRAFGQTQKRPPEDP